MMADTESTVAGESIVDDGTTLNEEFTSISKDDSVRKLERPKRASSIYTVGSISSRRRMSLGTASLKDIVFGSFMLLPMLPRISAAQREFALVHRGSSATPLLKQRKVLEDLLKLTRSVATPYFWTILIVALPLVYVETRCHPIYANLPLH